MRAPTPSSELALRIGFTYQRDPLLKLQQLDRCEYLPHQDAGAIPRTEDHHSPDAYGQIDTGNDLPKLGLSRFWDRIGGIQGEMWPMKPLGVRALRLGHADRSQAIPLRNHCRLGRHIQCQLHRLGHAPNLVGKPLDDPPQLLGVRRLETGRVDGKPGEPTGDLRDHSWCESGRKEHQQHVGRI